MPQSASSTMHQIDCQNVGILTSNESKRSGGNTNIPAVMDH